MSRTQRKILRPIRAPSCTAGVPTPNLSICALSPGVPGLPQELRRSCMRMPKFISLQYRHMARPYDWNPSVEQEQGRGPPSRSDYENEPRIVSGLPDVSANAQDPESLTNKEDGKVQVREHNGTTTINNEILSWGIIGSDVVGTSSGPIHVGFPLNEVTRPAWTWLVVSDKDVLLNPRSSEIAATDSWIRCRKIDDQARACISDTATANFCCFISHQPPCPQKASTTYLTQSKHAPGRRRVKPMIMIDGYRCYGIGRGTDPQQGPARAGSRLMHTICGQHTRWDPCSSVLRVDTSLAHAPGVPPDLALGAQMRSRQPRSWDPSEPGSRCLTQSRLRCLGGVGDLVGFTPPTSFVESGL